MVKMPRYPAGGTYWNFSLWFAAPESAAKPHERMLEKAAHEEIPCRWHSAVKLLSIALWVSCRMIEMLLPGEHKVLEKQVLQEPGWSSTLEPGRRTSSCS